MYSIRFATKGDYDFLYSLLELTMKDYYIDTYGSWNDEIERNFFNESFNSLKYHILVYEEHDVGCIVITNNDSEIFINEIQILPQYQNRGLGREIFESIFKDSDRVGLPIKLEVLKANRRACSFYYRMGFEKTGETQTHFIMTRKSN